MWIFSRIKKFFFGTEEKKGHHEFFDITNKLAHETENGLNNLVVQYMGFDYEIVKRFKHIYLKSNIRLHDKQLLKDAIYNRDFQIIEKYLGDNDRLDYDKDGDDINIIWDIATLGSKYGNYTLLLYYIQYSQDAVIHMMHACDYHNTVDVLHKVLYAQGISEIDICNLKKYRNRCRFWKFLKKCSYVCSQIMPLWMSFNTGCFLGSYVGRKYRHDTNYKSNKILLKIRKFMMTLLNDKVSHIFDIFNKLMIIPFCGYICTSLFVDKQREKDRNNYSDCFWKIVCLLKK
jgi:hypothetical protein